MTATRVVILGAGPAGLGGALELAERAVEVEVVERGDAVGGNAGSFELAGLRVDYGSHRLHPSTDPAILRRLRELLGGDLLERPRHGRIHLLGHWIHFPLRPLDLALRLPPRFAAGAASDVLRKALLASRAPSTAEESFASLLERGLGRTICREFYFPYARKIWGLEPEEISPIQARRRVAAGSVAELLRRLFPGGRGTAAPKGTFLYPRRGFGQISERLGEAALDAGARLALGTAVRRVAIQPGGGFEVEVEGKSESRTISADHVWSTIPAAHLAQLADPPASEEVQRAAARLELRAMLLVYLVLQQDRFSEYDAHYFPAVDIPFTRVSEPKNYAGLEEPRGRTVLCAEIPCSTADPVWSMEAEALGAVVVDGLGRAELPVTPPILEVVVRRLPAAYPIYRRGYEAHFERLDAWLAGIEGLLSFGRQGLFAHDNAHHALYMARAAVDCLRSDGRLDRGAWARYRRIFETHVVED
jgi:protoporphyrinogen oxidase